MRSFDKIKGVKIDAFTRAYLECALWSSTDESRDDGGDPLDQNYEIEDIERKSLAQMARDCRDFQEEFAELLTKAYADTPCPCEADGAPAGHATSCAWWRKPSYTEEQAGHDFWLTRNGHGAGFWDRGLGKIGEALTKASKSYGSEYLHVYRGRIYNR